MRKEDKQQVVEELTQRLQESHTLIVADYRGLTMPQIDALRTELLQHGARFRVVKNTLTRRAAEAAGAEAVLALLEGPSAIAFLEADGDPVAVAKAISAAARETRVLEVRGGVLEGRSITAADVESLAKLPPLEQLRGQALGAMTAPLYAIVGLFTAPLQNLHGLIDARIEQLQAQGDTSAAEAEAPGGSEASNSLLQSPDPAETTAEAEGAGAAAEAGDGTDTEAGGGTDTAEAGDGTDTAEAGDGTDETQAPTDTQETTQETEE